MSNPTFGSGKSGRGGGTGSASVIVTPNTGLQGNGTSVNPLAGVPASTLVPGTESIADFNKLATVIAGQSLGVASIVGPIDMKQAAGTTFTIVPARPGFAFIPSRMNVVIKAIAGFVTTSTVKIGSNVAHDNYQIASAMPNAAQVAQGVGSEAAIAIAVGVRTNNAAVVGEITIPANATTLTAYFCYTGYWLAI